MTTKATGMKNQGVKGWGASARTRKHGGALVGTWQTLWIRQLYETFLGRQASPEEVQRHRDQLAAGLDPKRLPRALGKSREGREQTIKGLYRRYLGRCADPVGLRHYRKALGSGRSRTEIERDLLVSAEYASIQGRCPEGWLRGLYQDVHGRAADAAGLEYFAEDLDEALSSKASLALTFLESHERRERWVRLCYVEILGRPPHQHELRSWARSLAQGTELDEVRYALAASLAAPRALTRPQMSSVDAGRKRARPTLAAAVGPSRAAWGDGCRAESA